MIAKAQIATTPIGRAGGNRRGQRAQGGGWVAGGDGDDAGMGGVGMGGRGGGGWVDGSPGAPAVRGASGPGCERSGNGSNRVEICARMRGNLGYSTCFLVLTML